MANSLNIMTVRQFELQLFQDQPRKHGCCLHHNPAPHPNNPSPSTQQATLNMISKTLEGISHWQDIYFLS